VPADRSSSSTPIAASWRQMSRSTWRASDKVIPSRDWPDRRWFGLTDYLVGRRRDCAWASVRRAQLARWNRGPRRSVLLRVLSLPAGNMTAVIWRHVSALLRGGKVYVISSIRAPGVRSRARTITSRTATPRSPPRGTALLSWP
jgi:hypothetical protein